MNDFWSEVWSLGSCLFVVVSALVVGFGIWRAWTPSITAYVKTIGPTASDSGIPVPEPVPGTSTPDREPSSLLDIVNDRLDDSQIVTVLASIRSETTKTGYRFSGNEICTLVKGKREYNLAVIREVRSGEVQYYNDLIERVNREVYGDGSKGTERDGSDRT